MSEGTAASRSWVNGIIPDAANRERDDYYPTPPRAIEALMAVEPISGSVWEPACGDGALVGPMERAGCIVTATDLIDRGFGIGGVDFLLDFATAQHDWVITNPPFKLAEEFAEHALGRAKVGVAMLCRLAWLEGVARGKMFRATPLSAVWVFSGRLGMQRGRQAKANEKGKIAFAWYVWRHGYEGPPRLGWLP